MDDGQAWRTLLDLAAVVATIAGGVGAAFITSRLTRKSQAESNKINEANGLAERYSAFTASIQAERVHERDRNKYLERQVSLWRRWTYGLRGQIYKLGGEPEQAPPELDQ